MSGVGVLRCGGSEVTSLDGSSTERGAVSSSTGDCSVWGRGDHGSYRILNLGVGTFSFDDHLQ